MVQVKAVCDSMWSEKRYKL